MKKTLIITYYWPPSGGGGVQRWLKFSKYLPEAGWIPVIYTPENPDSSVYDESLQKEIHPQTEIIKHPIWEPYHAYRMLTGKKKDEKFKAGYISEAAKGGFKERISVFIRGNLLIPDPRMFWINPSVRFLSKYLKENHVDLIVSTGPPHSMHMIALKLKKKLNIPWIADFRDPWTNIDFYDALKLTHWADKRHRKMEEKVLKAADRVVTVSWNWAEQIKNDHKIDVDVITNGFDFEDFQNEETGLTKKFTITHVGAFNQDRNPFHFWEALHSMVLSDKEFQNNLEIILIGQTDQKVIESIEKQGLKDNLTLISFVEHKKINHYLKQSQLLLLPINNTQNSLGIVPGKIFEYLAAKRPVFAIGPVNGDSGKIITGQKAGIICNFDDADNIKLNLLTYYTQYKEGRLNIDDSDMEKYSRKVLAKQFISLFDKIKNAKGL
jgi:glycosyltransferase involved in cell wall biosynthesis